MELMQEDDPRRASVDRISERSGVSKATIYKWWPNRTAAAIDRNLRAGALRAMSEADNSVGNSQLHHGSTACGPA